MVSTQLEELIATLEACRPLAPVIDATGRLIREAVTTGRHLYTAGNGGSAADALHLAEELIGRFDKDRRPLPAMALCADATSLTCIANDYGFEQIYARQVEALGRPGDVLVVFSTSGKSPNLLAALRAARARGVVTIGVLGKGGGPARDLVDHALIVPSAATARIQEVHTFILHAWLALVEEIT